MLINFDNNSLKIECIFLTSYFYTGAEAFYQIEENPVRSEGIELARKLDSLTIESWVGHPYIDVIDNSMANFDMKMRAMIEVISF